MNSTFISLLSIIFVFGLWGLLIFVLRSMVRHLSRDPILDGHLPFWTRVLPNYLALFAATGVILVSFMYPDSMFSIYREFNQVKRNSLDCFVAGALASGLVAILDNIKSPILIMISIFFSVLLLLPAIGMDWTSEAALVGSLGKIVSFGTGMAVYAEIKKRLK